MFGLGTIINTASVIVGGLLGFLFGKFLKERHRSTLTTACGVSVLFIATAGAMAEMMKIDGTSLVSGQSMFVVVCLVLGAFIGELLNIQGWFERFGEWLKRKTGNAKDRNFVNGFVTASLTECIGAMTVVGSIQDGIFGDWTILATKAVLDMIITMVLTGSMGKGCVFAAIPIFVIQGSLTLLARVIRPIMTEAALFNLSLIGSILIFCVGINLVWDKKIRVANFLPSLVLAVGAAFLPFSF